VDKANTQNENPERNTTKSQQKQKLRTKINQTQKLPIDLAKDDGNRNEIGASISGCGNFVRTQTMEFKIDSQNEIDPSGSGVFVRIQCICSLCLSLNF
jgi:hypothetical protein